MVVTHRLSFLKPSFASLTGPCSFTVPKEFAVRRLFLFLSILFLSRAQADAGVVNAAEDTPLAQMWAGVRTLRYADVSFLSFPSPFLPRYLSPMFRPFLPPSLSSSSPRHSSSRFVADPLSPPSPRQNRAPTRSTSTNSAAPSSSVFPPSRPATSVSSRRRRRGGGSRSFELTSTTSEEKKDSGFRI